MSKIGKRLLSLAIVLLMVLSMIPAQPVHVHASETTPETQSGNVVTLGPAATGADYNAFKAALAAVEPGGTIKMLGDISHNSAEAITKDFTLDVNGNTLIINSGSFTVNTNVDVVFKDSATTVDADGNVVHTGGIRFVTLSAAYFNFGTTNKTYNVTFDGIRVYNEEGKTFGRNFMFSGAGVTGITISWVNHAKLDFKNFASGTYGIVFDLDRPGHTKMIVEDSVINYYDDRGYATAFEGIVFETKNAKIYLGPKLYRGFMACSGVFVDTDLEMGTANQLIYGGKYSGSVENYYFVGDGRAVFGGGVSGTANQLYFYAEPTVTTSKLTATALEARVVAQNGTTTYYSTLDAAVDAAAGAKELIIVGGTHEAIPAIEGVSVEVRGGAFASDPAANLAAGMITVYDGTNYTVQKMPESTVAYYKDSAGRITKLLNEVTISTITGTPNNGTLVLLDDATVYVGNKPFDDKAITVDVNGNLLTFTDCYLKITEATLTITDSQFNLPEDEAEARAYAEAYEGGFRLISGILTTNSKGEQVQTNAFALYKDGAVALNSVKAVLTKEADLQTWQGTFNAMNNTAVCYLDIVDAYVDVTAGSSYIFGGNVSKAPINVTIDDSIVNIHGVAGNADQVFRYAILDIDDSYITANDCSYTFIYSVGSIDNTKFIVTNGANNAILTGASQMADYATKEISFGAGTVFTTNCGVSNPAAAGVVIKAHKCAITQFSNYTISNFFGEHTEVDIPSTDATCGAVGVAGGKQCSVCGTITVEPTETPATGAHTWGDWITDTEANCGVDGTQHRVCSACGTVENGTISASGEHTAYEDDGDCTTSVNCKVCGQVVVPAAAAHVPEEDDGDVSTAVKCANCDVIVVEAINAVAEIWKDGVLTGHLVADETLGDVINAIDFNNKGYTIKLLKDAELITRRDVTITAATVIDLNGHKLTMGETGYLYVQADLTITDSAENGELYITSPNKVEGAASTAGKHIFSINSANNVPEITFENIKITLRSDYNAATGSFVSIGDGVGGAVVNFNNVDVDVVKLRSNFIYGTKKVANYVNISNSTFDIEDANGATIFYIAIVDIKDTTIVANNGNRLFSFATGTVSNTDIELTEFNHLSMTYYNEKEEQMPWLKDQGLPTTLTFDKDCSLKGSSISAIEGYETFIHVCAKVEDVEHGFYYGEHTDANDDAICDVCEAELVCKHAGLTAEAKKDATCTAAGHNAYWHCKDCGVYFADATAETVIEDIDEWKAVGGAGYIAPIAHTYTEEVTKTPTCKETGVKTYTCSCGDTKTETLAKDPANHVDGTKLVGKVNATCGKDGYTGDTVCNGCGETLEKGEIDPATGKHNYIEEITKTPTCKETGVKTYTCGCGDTKTETLAKDPANHVDGTKLVGKEDATCGEDGYTGDTVCNGCGETLEKGEIDPATGAHTDAPADGNHACDVCGKADVTGHTYGEWIPVTDSTCTEAGVKKQICSDCAYEDFGVIGAKGHNWTFVDGQAPTCQAEGWNQYQQCTRCVENTKAQQMLEKVDHVYTKYTYNNDATYDADGTETASCDFGCGNTDTREVPGTQLENPVAQIGDAKFGSLQAAIEAAEAGDKIVLLNNIALDEAGVIVDKTITLDLNNYNIESVGETITVIAGGDLTIIGNGNVTGNTDNYGSGSAVWAKGGKATIKGGTYSTGFDGETYLLDAHSNDTIYTSLGGEIVIEDGTFVQTDYVWVLNEKANNQNTLTVKGGTFVGFNPSVANDADEYYLAEGFVATKDAEGNYAVVEGEWVAEVGGIKYATLAEAIEAAEAGDKIVLVNNVALDEAGVIVDKTITLDLNNYNIESVGETITVIAGGDLTIIGNGNVTGNTDNYGSGSAVWAKGGKATIKGGTYSTGFDGETYLLDAHSNDTIYTSLGGEIVIEDGTFVQTDYVWVLNEKANNQNTLTVKGGTFVGFNPSVANDADEYYLAEGFVATKDAEGNYAVVEGEWAAEVGGIKYATLAEAIEAAEAGDKIVLLNNIALDEAGVIVDKTITLDLNNYNIESVGETITVIAGGDLTIIGNGNVTGNTDNYGSGSAVWAKGGKATIKGGTYSTGFDGETYLLDAHSNDTIYTSLGGEIVIEDGTFVQTDYVWVLNEKANNQNTLTVKGGTFVGFNPSVANDADEYYLAEGFVATKDAEGNYAVVEGEWVAEVGGIKYATLAEALAADGATVTLLTDVSVANVTVIPDDKTLDLNGNTVTGTVLGKIVVNGGNYVTAEDYKMIGADADYYKTTDAVFTMTGVTGDITLISGTVELVPELWYTLPGQTLTVEAGAKFVIPEGKALYVNDSTVIVKGAVENNGTVIIADGGFVKGNITGAIQMAGGTFATSDYTMAGVAADAIYYTENALFIIEANYDTTIVSGTMKLNLAQWWTLPGQKLVVESGATFEVPAGTKLSVNGSNVVVNGNAIVAGTVELLTADATVAYKDNSLLANFTTPAGDKVLYVDGKYIVHDHTKVTDKAVAPDCVNTGLTEGSHCETCGEILVAQNEVPALGHDYITNVVAPTCETAGYTEHDCSRCDEYYTDTPVDALGHKYIGTQTKAPECGVEGEMTYVCENDASHTYTEAIPALQHNYIGVPTAPTCEAKGYTTYTCELCGDSYVANYVDALGHKYIGTQTKAPACGVEGEMTYVCENDASHTYTEAIPALQHNYIGVPTAPTCEAKGYTTYTCELCGDSYVADYVDALGHKYIGTQTKAPACGVEGEMTYVCENDASHTYTEAIQALTHIAGAETVAERVEPTQSEDGYIKYVVKCELCGAQMSERTEVLPATGVVVAVIGTNEYFTVQSALDAATAGQTVKVVAPSEEAYIVVPAGVTLDLNGNTVTVGSAASFGVIMGNGKLAVGEYALAMPANNGKYLPVYENDGYVFKFIDLYAWKDGFEGELYVIEFGDYSENEQYIKDIIAAGDTNFDVVVRATWTSSATADAAQDFIFSDAYLADYVNAVGFRFKITGAVGLDIDTQVMFTYKVGNYVVEVTDGVVTNNAVAGNKVESVENAAPVATVGGVEYYTVAEALANAASGATVTVTASSTEKVIMVPAGVTLVLNADLTVESAASFGTIMGNGKLIVGEYNLAMPANNGKYLPVYENDGYVFKFIDLYAWKDGFEGELYVVEFGDYSENEQYIKDIIAAGDTNFDVVVRATWTSSATADAAQDFIFSDAYLADYVNAVGFRFKITGAVGLEINTQVMFTYKVGNYVVEVTD